MIALRSSPPAVLQRQQHQPPQTQLPRPCHEPFGRGCVQLSNSCSLSTGPMTTLFFTRIVRDLMPFVGELDLDDFDRLAIARAS